MTKSRKLRPGDRSPEATYIAAVSKLLPLVRQRIPDAEVFTVALGERLVRDGRTTDATISEAGQVAARVGGFLVWSEVGGVFVIDPSQLR